MVKAIRDIIANSYTIYVIYHYEYGYKNLMFYVKNKDDAERICEIKQNELLEVSADNYFDYETLKMGLLYRG